MTDDEIETLAKKHICPHHDRLDAILPNRVPYQQTEQFRRVKALIGDVLSKLRAPVADEQQPDGKRPDLDWIEGVRVTDTLGRGWCVRIDGTDIFEDVNRYGCKGRKSFQIASGLASKQEAERAALEWIDRQRAALASAPVAGEAQPVATLHDDGYYTWHGATPDGYAYAGWRMPVYAGPQASEAVRDVERLEFLITHGAWVAWSKDHELCRVFHRDDDGDIEPFLSWRESARAAAYTARDAIDAAMAALSAQPGAQKDEPTSE